MWTSRWCGSRRSTPRGDGVPRPPPTAINDLKRDLGDKIKCRPTTGTPNERRKPFGDVRVSRARSLNTELQKALNTPGESRVERFGWTFYPGDKVMQVENDHDREVHNGDLGIVQRIDQGEGELVVTFDGRDVSYGFGEPDELVLVYATTIHKSQGSEYPAVVIPLVTQHYMMLARNLLYTGVTRGKRLVVLVGQRKALAIAVRNHGSRRRWAKLREHLTGTQSNQLTISREEH